MEKLDSFFKALQPVYLCELKREESEFEVDVPLMTATARWKSGAFDPLLCAVADDSFENPLLVGIENSYFVSIR